jgi:Mitochondrial carrier protein
MHKQVLYTGLRLGLYQHLAESYEEGLPLHLKIVYATLTTGFGIMVANPADVVQTKYIAYRTKAPQPTAAPAPASAAASAAAQPPRPPMTAPPGSSAHSRAGSGSRGFATSARVGHSCCSMHSLAVPGSPLLQHRALMHTCQLRGHGLLAHSGLHRHVYRHHLRWRHSARHILPSVLESSAASARPRMRWQPGMQTLGTSVRGMCAARGPGNAAAQSAAPTATHSPSALLPIIEPGPSTVTGKPLQNARKAYYIILREEGFANGLYRGFWPNFACSCVQGAAEIATYDVAKHSAIAAGYADSYPVHLASGAMPAYCWYTCGCISNCSAYCAVSCSAHSRR